MTRENNKEILDLSLPPEDQRFLFKMSYSITGLISVTFFGLLAIIVSLIISGSKIEKDIYTQQKNGMLQDKTMNLLSTQIDMRRLERSFVQEKNKEFVNQYHVLANKAMDIIAEIREKYSNEIAETIYAELYQNIQKQIQFFELEAMHLEGLGFNENQGLQGQLRKLARDIEVYVTKEPQSSLKKELFILYLNLRRHEKDFISRLDPKYVEMAQAEFNMMVRQPHPATAALNQVHEDVKVLGRKYMEGLNAFAKVILLEKDANQKLIDSYNAFTISLSRALNYISDQTASQREIELNSIQLIKNTMGIAAFVFLTLIGLYGIIIIRRIVNSILTKP
ncbi:MAG: hypothetical protein IBJ00_06110 [Alphaproteobacteria bacterium]|nr:hypothetical protein [Alphaproteobacteria bacterium]